MENKVNKLPLIELFNTLQGEGFHTGKPATFIRLAGCDVGCFWCDVKESWDSELHPSFSVENIVSKALKYKAKFACKKLLCNQIMESFTFTLSPS